MARGDAQRLSTRISPRRLCSNGCSSSAWLTWSCVACPARTSSSPRRRAGLAWVTVAASTSHLSARAAFFMNRGSGVQEQGEQRLLHVQAILRLVPDRRAFPVENLRSDLLARVGRQAVHDEGIRRRMPEQGGVEPVALEVANALVMFLLLAHADP